MFWTVILAVLVASVRSQSKFRCYDCNSGHMGWVHEDCPTNGQLNGEKISSVPCDERCFTRTNRWTPGVIHRGCSIGHYLPRPGLPESGCDQDPNGDMWCFCTQDYCNTDDMTSYL